MLVKLTIGKRDRGLAKIQTRNIKTGRLRQRVRHRLVGGRGRHLLRRWSVSFDRWEEEDEIGFESRLSKYLSSAGNNFTSFTLSQDCIFCSFGIPVLCIKCWWNQPQVSISPTFYKQLLRQWIDTDAFAPTDLTLILLWAFIFFSQKKSSEKKLLLKSW